VHPWNAGRRPTRLSEERKARRHWLGLDKALVIQEEHADVVLDESGWMVE
jgi:hypothetical protein